MKVARLFSWVFLIIAGVMGIGIVMDDFYSNHFTQMMMRLRTETVCLALLSAVFTLVSAEPKVQPK